MALNTITNNSPIANARGLPTGTFINYFNDLVRAVNGSGVDNSGLQIQIDRLKELVAALELGHTDDRVDQLVNQMDYVLDYLNTLTQNQNNQADYFADVINLKTSVVIMRAELYAFEGFVIHTRGEISRLKTRTTQNETELEDHETRITNLEAGSGSLSTLYGPLVTGAYLMINEVAQPRWIITSDGSPVYGRIR